MIKAVEAGDSDRLLLAVFIWYTKNGAEDPMIRGRKSGFRYNHHSIVRKWFPEIERIVRIGCSRL